MLKEIIGRSIQFFLIIITLIVMYFGGVKFLIISLIFFFSGGVFEFIIMNFFIGKAKKSITKKDKIATKINNAFLWVHKNIIFIKTYGTTVYNFDKVGFLVSIFAYLTMFLYVVLAFFLFRQFSYYGFLIYLIPIISNTYCFVRNRYLITN